MADRSHLSIGEVLSLLQADFPDITISKIRFLESQGLLDPERTPSGYRKFYESDIGRLRWILRQQRENFLPLKVIKDRLAAGEVDFAADDDTADAETPGTAESGATSSGGSAPGTPPVEGDGEPAAHVEPPVDPSPAPNGRPREHAVSAAPAPPVRPAAALLQEAPTPRPAHVGDTAPATGRTPAAPPPPPPLFDVGATAVNMTLEELTSATGLTNREVGDLERFGMMSSRALGSTTYYDEDALLVARLAAKFKTHGVEARHLRMYRVAAEREAGVFEQLIMPMMRKRSPQGRREATELLNELAALGNGLRAAMLRQLLRDYFDGA